MEAKQKGSPKLTATIHTWASQPLNDLTRAHPALKDNQTTPSLPRIEVNGCHIPVDKIRAYQLQVHIHQRLIWLLTVTSTGKWMVNQVSGKLHRISICVDLPKKMMRGHYSLPPNIMETVVWARAALRLTFSHLPSNSHPSVSIILRCGFVDTARKSENAEERVKSPAEIEYDELPFRKLHYLVPRALHTLETICLRNITFHQVQPKSFPKQRSFTTLRSTFHHAS